MFLVAISLIAFYSCSKENEWVEATESNLTQQELKGPGNGNGVIHHVSVGGNDACSAFGLPPGCDKSYTLVANMRADGSVTGQWQDGFAGDVGGIHVSIDCLMIVGNAAIVGGVITHGSVNGNDLTGQYAVTAAWDNGTSNNDPDDQISYSYFGVDPNQACNYDISVFQALDLERGQVRVW